jgi:hypothetical protein
MVDDVGVEIAISTDSLPKREEGRGIVVQLNALKADIQNDATLR